MTKKDLLHSASEPCGGDAGDNLLPKEGADAKEDAPGPLLNVQRHRWEQETPKLDNENLGLKVKHSVKRKSHILFLELPWDKVTLNIYRMYCDLWHKGGNPDDIVDRVWEEPLEDVPLPVDLPESNYCFSKVIFSNSWTLYKVVKTSNENWLFKASKWSLPFLQF